MIILFLKNDEVKEEIIWPDDRISKFKNKYMCHLKDKFSTTYTRFLWKFSATSHNKGAVDGIHGNVNSTVQSHWAKERTRSLCRMQSLSIKLAAKQWTLPKFFQLIKPKLKHTGTLSHLMFSCCAWNHVYAHHLSWRWWCEVVEKCIFFPKGWAKHHCH